MEDIRDPASTTRPVNPAETAFGAAEATPNRRIDLRPSACISLPFQAPFRSCRQVPNL